MAHENNTNTTQAVREEGKPVGLGIYLEGVSRCNSSSNNSQDSSVSHKIETPENETYEEKLSRYRKFFDNGPLMRCLDKEEDEQRAREVLFNTLLTDVQQNRLDDKNYRGLVQIRSFWENVRNQLRVDDEDESA